MDKDRTAPLSSIQRVQLLSLVKERELIITDKSTSGRAAELKRRAWRDIGDAFNAMNPDQEPRTNQQLKRSFDHVKRK